MIDEINIGIRDVRQVVDIVQNQYGIDLKDYSLTSFKRRLKIIINNHSLRDADNLIDYLKKDDVFFQFFLKDLHVPDTELFRDPSVWRAIRFQVIKELYETSKRRLKIWLPGCTSGEELFSLLILLKESYLLDKVDVIATSISEKWITKIKTGSFDLKKLEINKANYIRLKGQADFSKYYEIKNATGYWDLNLLQNVQFLENKNILADSPKGVSLTIFRNRLIYYNSSLQDKVIEKLHKSISIGGFLVVGIKETLRSRGVKPKFKLVNDTEKIYKKNF